MRLSWGKSVTRSPAFSGLGNMFLDVWAPGEDLDDVNKAYYGNAEFKRSRRMEN